MAADLGYLSDTTRSQVTRALREVAQREYMHGWRYGLVCGLVAGLCTTGLAVLLVSTVLAAWG